MVSKSSKIDASQLLRLKLARRLLFDANNKVGSVQDGYFYCAKVLSTHDAIDNLVAASLSHLDAQNSSDRDSLFQNYLTLIKSKKYGKFKKYKADIKLLNSIRNGIKHHGLLPNEKQVPPLLDRLDSFIDDTCIAVFGFQINSVSISHLITDIKAREAVEAVEILISKGEHKEAMEATSTVLFNHIEASASHYMNSLYRILSPPKDPLEAIFLSSENTLSVSKYVFESGVDPYLYHRVKNLLPEVGLKNNSDNSLVYRLDPNTWHEKNWTEQNALFCIGVTIEVILGNQKDYTSLYEIKDNDSYPFVHLGLTKDVTPLSAETGEALGTLSSGDYAASISGYANGVWYDFYGHTKDMALVTLYKLNDLKQMVLMGAHVPKDSIIIRPLTAEEKKVLAGQGS